MQRSDATNAIEALESRVLFAGASIVNKDTLQIIGSVKVDSIFITYGPDQLDRIIVKVDGVQQSFKFDDVKKVTVQAGAKDDLVEFRALALNNDYWKIPVTIYGSNGNDHIIAPAGLSRVYGGAGNDTIIGGPSRDIIYGEIGDDSIMGMEGNDYIHGDEGNDTIFGGRGSDNMYGDAGNDTLYSSDDLITNADLRPFIVPTSFDRVDGGGGFDRASADPKDRLISIEEMFTAT